VYPLAAELQTDRAGALGVFDAISHANSTLAAATLEWDAAPLASTDASHMKHRKPCFSGFRTVDGPEQHPHPTRLSIDCRFSA
jgi:hypothetical protein